MMKVLITGINGFVGRILHHKLLNEGYQVFGIDIHSNGSSISQVDITDKNAVHECIQRTNPDSIIHLAALSSVQYSNPELLYSINTNGTINVLTASISLKRKPNIIIISSSQVYGCVDSILQPINESVLLKPINHYGASKASAEMISMAFRREYGIPLTIIRPFNHIGKGQSGNFVIPKIIRAFKERNSIIEMGDVTITRDYLDVRDVVDAYVMILKNFPDGEIFNISSGKGYTITDIIENMRKISGHEISISFNEQFMRKNDMELLLGESSRFRKQYKWEPRYNIIDTLKWIFFE